MSRIRTIKPDFWTNEKIMSCGAITRLLFIGMWNFADDYGRMQYSPLGLKAKVFPNDNFSASDVGDMLNELCSNGLMVIYSANDKEYIEITGWDHQRIDKRQISKIPGPFDDGSTLGNSTNPADSRRLTTTPAPVMEGKVEEGKVLETEANASGAEAPRDVRTVLFSDGLETLARITGKTPNACRSFVGKCLKAAEDNAITVLGLIEEADRNRIADPAAWIVASLRATGPPGKPLTAFQQSRAQTQDILNDLDNFATGRGSGSETNFGVLPGHSGQRSEIIRSGTRPALIDISARSRQTGG